MAQRKNIPVQKPVQKKEKKQLSIKNTLVLSIVSIIGLGFIIYSNSFNCGFHFDDAANIVDNTSIRDLHNLRGIWQFGQGRIIGFITFALDYHFHQYNLWGYHFVNLWIHILNALLVWCMARIIMSSPVIKGNSISQHKNLISLLAALVFISHPIETQAVTYIVQRLASLATLFYLLSICLYATARVYPFKTITKVLFFIASILCAVTGMFTKEIVFTLTFAIILFEVFFMGKNRWKISFKNPFVIGGIVVLASMLIIIPSMFSFSIFNKINPEQGLNYSLTPLTYLLTQFRVITTYIRLLFIPVNQMLDYDFSISQSLFEVKTFAALIFLILIFISGILLYKNYRLLSFGIFWFFLTLLVESSIIPIVNVIFEHRLYLSSVGFALFITGGLFYLFYHKRKEVFLVIILAFIGINSWLTYQRNEVWKDEYSLWGDNVKKTPGKARPWNNYGKILKERGDYEGAVEAYTHSIEINPNYETPYYNRANARQDMRDFKGAIEDYSSAIKVSPKMGEAYNNRGTARLTIGDVRGAIEDFTKVIQFIPDFNEFTIAYNNRGLAKNSLGLYNQAIGDFNFVISKMPKFRDAWLNRGISKSGLGKYDEAIADYTIAISLDSMEARSYLSRGLAKFNLHNYKDAIRDYDDAIRLNPSYTEAFVNRGQARFNTGDYNGSLSDFNEAIKINPSMASAYKNRGLMKYYQMKDTKGACADWQKAGKLGDNSVVGLMSQFCK